MSSRRPHPEPDGRDSLDEVIDDLLAGADEDLQASLTCILDVQAGANAILGHSTIEGPPLIDQPDGVERRAKNTAQQEDRDARPRTRRENAGTIRAFAAFSFALTTILAILAIVAGIGLNPTTLEADSKIPTVAVAPSTVTVTTSPYRPIGTELFDYRRSELERKAPGTVWLTDLHPIEISDVSRDSLAMITDPRSDSLYQLLTCTRKSSVTYQLNHRYDNFEAVIDTLHSSRADDSALFAVSVDGRQGPEEQVAPGESRIVRADVSGGYRMTLSVTGSRPTGCTDKLIASWTGRLKFANHEGG